VIFLSDSKDIIPKYYLLQTQNYLTQILSTYIIKVSFFTIGTSRGYSEHLSEKDW